MPIENIPLEQIDDNPFNPRKIYKSEKVNEIAYSIERFGQLETPKGRRVGDRVQLAFGHVRLRAFRKLAKQDSEKFGCQPVNIEDLSDADMFYFAWEENMKRSDTTPIEQARAIDYFMNAFPDLTEAEVAEKLKLKQPTVANMRRVLYLPAKILNLIDDGTINFTMARELLVFSGRENSATLMDEVLGRVKTIENPNRQYTSTVSGLQTSIWETCQHHFAPLKEGQAWGSYAHPLFDTKDCMRCPKMITAHRTAKEGSDWCTDLKCWGEKQEAAKAAIAAAEEAKAKEKPAVDAPVKQPVKQPVKEPVEQRVEHDDKQRVEQPAKEVAVPGSIGAMYPDSWVGEHRRQGREAGIPQGIRMDIDVPQSECKDCPLSSEDHTIGMKYGRGNSFFKVCVKDYRAWAKGTAEEAVEKTGEAPAPEPAGNGHDKETGDAVLTGGPRESVPVAEPPEHKTSKAEGQAKKRAEAKAIKKAIASADALPKALNMLVLLAEVKRASVSAPGQVKKHPITWLWDKLSPGRDADTKTDPELFRLIYKMKEKEVAELVTELMFYHLQYEGPVEDYEIKTTAPLSWFGVDVKAMLAEAEAKASA